MIHVDSPTDILVIDDEPGIHKCLNLLLRPDYSVHAALSGEEGLEKMDVISPDLVLLDLIMPRMSGMEVLNRLSQDGRDVPTIIFTAHGSVDSAVRAIKLGAVDYIEKPFDDQKFKQTVRQILKGRRSFRSLSACQNIVGESPQIQKVWSLVEKYGPTDLPILLQGETGTGKELFANAIHEISKRSHEPFVPVDCSTIPETLFESEIFGYERGAFTGANISKPGQLDWADGGTFYLDEIPNLPLPYQAKLLRVIQERQYVPLGARTAKQVDVRFISSSNIDLSEAVQRDAFRQDLYYRTAGVCIELPPLRERKGDVELLAQYFIDKYSGMYHKVGMETSRQAMELLLSYPWPGNVREMEHAMGAAVASADRVVLPEHLPPSLRRSTTVSKGNGNGKARFELSFACDVTKPIDLKELRRRIASDVERAIIAEVKRRHSLSQTELASFLGLDPKTLRAKSKMRRVESKEHGAKSMEQRAEGREHGA
jgi:two-component system response regulator AtoC